MKYLLSLFITSVICLTLVSFRSGDDFQLDWKRITDKDYIVKYTSVVYDTIHTKYLGPKAHDISIDEHSKTLSKNQVRRLQTLISNKDNFEEAFDPDCDSAMFTHAFVVFRANDVAGIVELSCSGNHWLFEPGTTSKVSLMISEKGIKLKDELLKELK
jgi:hypothetical protein